MAISKRQLELMGAELKLESEAGKGSRFYFEVELPPARETVTSTTTDDHRKIIGLKEGHSVKALVVDDVQHNRDVLSQLLRGVGVEVAIADSGPAALELLRHGLPDIIFLDIRMPEMDGTEVAQRIHTQFGEGKAILVAISASVLSHEQEEYLQSGFAEFISKPFRLEEVCNSIQRLLEVQFDREAKESAMNLAPDASQYAVITITPDLLSRLKTSAELYSTTELREQLDELMEGNSDAKNAIAHLHTLNESGAMEELLELLEKMRVSE